MEHLAKEYQVFAPFFPGTGGTTRSLDLDLTNLCDLVLYYYDLFGALSLENFDLIGHSFGGMLAAEIAATAPKRISNLLLISSAGLWNEQFPTADASALSSSWPEALPEDPNERTQALVEQYVSMAETTRYLWPIPDKGLSRRIHRIQANTCMIWGERDGLIPVRYAYEFQEKIPGSRVESLQEQVICLIWNNRIPFGRR